MPDTFTDEYNLVKPEIGGSIDTWGTKLNQNADVLEQTLLRIEESLVGMLAHFPIDSGTPSGWLRCNGWTYQETEYPRLFARIGRTYGGVEAEGTFKVPDYRGVFLRGLDDGKGLDTGRGLTGTQPDQNKQHNHGGTTENSGGHSHGASSESSGYHTHNTSTNGNHNHGGDTWSNGGHHHSIFRDFNNTSWEDEISSSGHYVAHRGWGGGGGPIPDYNMRRATSGAFLGRTSEVGNHAHGIGHDGNHSHNVHGNGAHKHTININSVSSHDHGINNEGGDEARPVNMAALICIKT